MAILFRPPTQGPCIMLSDYESAILRKLGPSGIEYLIISNAHFHDDIMCRLKRGCVQRRLCSIAAAIAVPPSLMISTKDLAACWSWQAPRTSLKHTLKIHS